MIDLTSDPCWLILTKLNVILVYKVKCYEHEIELNDRVHGYLVVLCSGYVSIFLILGWSMTLLAHHYFFCVDITHALLSVEYRAYSSGCFETSLLWFRLFSNSRLSCVLLTSMSSSLIFWSIIQTYMSHFFSITKAKKRKGFFQLRDDFE